MNPRMRSRMPASIGSNQASPANNPVPSATVVLSCAMAWSPPACQRRTGSLQRTGDYATTRFHHPRDGTVLSGKTQALSGDSMPAANKIERAVSISTDKTVLPGEAVVLHIGNAEVD